MSEARINVAAQGMVRRFCNSNTANCMARGPRSEVTIAGVVAEFQERTSKAGGRYAFFKLEDQHSQVEFMVGSKSLNEYRELLSGGQPLLGLP